MGYTTSFNGVLKFTQEFTIAQLKMINGILGEDPIDHPEWVVPESGKAHYIQFQVTENMDGIEWDGTEKFYEAVNAVNTIIVNMRVEFPEFGLIGELKASGEDSADQWVLVADGDAAKREEIRMVRDVIKCPNCGETYPLTEDKNEVV